jgi:large subunit ribosomal protein L21
LPGKVGQQVELQDVLLVAGAGDTKIGRPTVEGAKVVATILAQEKGPKIRIFKYRPKERYRRRIGHRQYYTRLRVDKIVV